jgi:hypothetical protein
MTELTLTHRWKSKKLANEDSGYSEQVLVKMRTKDMYQWLGCMMGCMQTSDPIEGYF